MKKKAQWQSHYVHWMDSVAPAISQLNEWCDCAQENYRIQGNHIAQREMKSLYIFCEHNEWVQDTFGRTTARRCFLLFLCFFFRFRLLENLKLIRVFIRFPPLFYDDITWKWKIEGRMSSSADLFLVCIKQHLTTLVLGALFDCSFSYV